MMWPILTKGRLESLLTLTAVQYERLHILVSSRHLWRQIGVSLVVNWIIAPLVRPSLLQAILVAVNGT